jgi:hypothetical protein
VWSLGIVVDAPRFDGRLSLVQELEPVLIEARVTEPVVEYLDEGIV